MRGNTHPARSIVHVSHLQLGAGGGPLKSVFHADADATLFSICSTLISSSELPLSSMTGVSLFTVFAVALDWKKLSMVCCFGLFAGGSNDPEGTFSPDFRFVKNCDTFCCRPLNSGKFLVQYCGHFWEGNRATEITADAGQRSLSSMSGSGFSYVVVAEANL